MPFEEVQGETEHVEGLTGFLISTVLARHISRLVIRHCRLKRGHHRTFRDLQQQLCHALPLFRIPRSMGARTFRALSRDLRSSKLVCRHNLREHKEAHIVVEREARGGWQRLYIRIELLALLTLCRRCKGFNLAHEPLQHCWLHPMSPHGLITLQKRSRGIHDPVICASYATHGTTASTVMATVPQPTRVSSHILW